MTPNAVARLNGRQLKMLADGLRGAFTGFDDLRKMVLVALDERLHEIVNQQANFETQVWQLVEWADAKGKLQGLLQAAVEQVPDKPGLREAVNAVLGGAKTPDEQPQEGD